jgi:glycosyltransferase involved in cell wall biosynthesis
VVGSIGNLRSVKNHEMFIRAMSILSERFPDVAAIIVGQELPSEPDVARRLQEQIDDAGLDQRIKLLGFRDDVPRLLQQLEVLCLTSRSEGTPNVILEAMAADCPVVATAVGGIPDLIEDGSTGLLVPSDDSAALARALERLLAEAPLRHTLATNARRSVLAEHSCAAVAERFTTSYEQAAGPIKGAR